MFKKSLKLATLMVSAISLSACGGSSCSSEADVMAKGEEFQKKMEEMTASGDMGKMMALVGKMSKFEEMAKSNDFQAACDLMDELMADM
ncbi:MAG TPA: hypothetical protein PK055_00315 [Gammaproteobacteria bacterium]|nr:hypothetical protein [Xanthomonadales bacterium]MCB1594624.1 hypothetical protein [Xanthomonadales bacterium]HOP21459.1 hypothetical protein [Gammaproteobacteria bacterium]HPI94631.1 hypothetical protein [Gammaproteobacteria bacterium]HPQ86076.1 hypothetical protein [Gammaproteobacteria bacterium]